MRSEEPYITIFSTSGRVHVQSAQIQWYRPQCTTRIVRGSDSSLWCAVVGHFGGMVWVYLDPQMDGRVSGTQYKVILTDHLRSEERRVGTEW